MKSKILITSLGILFALLIFETGYLIGIGEQRARITRAIYPVWNAPRVTLERQPLRTREHKKSFFVAAMTSKETPQATIITINLPGLNKRDIKIDVKGRYLTVQAGKRREAGGGNKYYYSEELSAASFGQRITLSDNVRPEETRAEFNNENLTITIPKDKRARKASGKTINIPIR